MSGRRWYSYIDGVWRDHDTAVAAEEAARNAAERRDVSAKWGEVRAESVSVNEGGRWVRRLRVLIPPTWPQPATPFVVACADPAHSGRAVVSWGGAPIVLPLAALAAVLEYYPATHRATWGLGIDGDLRPVGYEGTVERMAGYPPAATHEELLRAVLRVAIDARERVAVFGGPDDTLTRDPVDGAWVVGQGPRLAPIERPDARADTRTTTTEGAAGHAARFAPPTTKEGPR